MKKELKWAKSRKDNQLKDMETGIKSWNGIYLRTRQETKLNDER